MEDILEGVFIEESKNRFICRILIEDEIHECYIASASRLDNYIKLVGKKVLLVKNLKENSRTRYSVFAVKYYNKYILLNLNIVNRIVHKYLIMNNKNCIVNREQYINEYKADFVITGNKNIVVEAKGIIATKRSVLFPIVYSPRAIFQLKEILNLLDHGCNVQYYFISLSPIVRTIIINSSNEYSEYHKLLCKCVEKGMEIKGFSVKYEKSSTIQINRRIRVML